MFKHSLSMLNSCGRRLLSVQQANGYDFAKLEKKLMEPFEYVKHIPYKHHTLMVTTFDHWLQVPKEKLDRIREASWDWISWGILIDDIRDDSIFRHGVPAAHQVFGVGAAINAASKSMFHVQKQILELGHPSALQVFMERTEEALNGEGLDVYWRDQCIFPPEEVHMEMTKKKGGTYFEFPIKLMQLFSNNKTDYTDLAITIGSYYEILDDYYNLFHPKSLLKLAMKDQESFRTNSDVTEGKITLAMIHASQFPDVATELADILKQRTSDPKLLSHAILLLKKHGSDEYVRDKLRKMEADIRAEVDQLGGNPILTAYMDDLCFQNDEPVPE